MNITSTSNNTNRMATKKYLILKGARASPTDSIPHSNTSFLTPVWRFGPNIWVAPIVKITKPKAAKSWKRIGRKSDGVDMFFFKEVQSYIAESIFIPLKEKMKGFF
jgi:hypothetical protein